MNQHVSTESDRIKIPFFPVSTKKLAVMSFFTMGIYSFYWFYKQWQYIRNYKGADFSPAVRTVVAPFYCYALFQNVNEKIEEFSPKMHFPVIPYTIGWVVLALCSFLPGFFSLIGVFSFLFFLPAQNVMNVINETIDPKFWQNNTFTLWNILGILLGILFYALVVSTIVVTIYYPADLGIDLR